MIELTQLPHVPRRPPAIVGNRKRQTAIIPFGNWNITASLALRIYVYVCNQSNYMYVIHMYIYAIQMCLQTTNQLWYKIEKIHTIEQSLLLMQNWKCIESNIDFLAYDI